MSQTATATKTSPPRLPPDLGVDPDLLRDAAQQQRVRVDGIERDRIGRPAPSVPLPPQRDEPPNKDGDRAQQHASVRVDDRPRSSVPLPPQPQRELPKKDRKVKKKRSEFATLLAEAKELGVSDPRAWTLWLLNKRKQHGVAASPPKEPRDPDEQPPRTQPSAAVAEPLGTRRLAAVILSVIVAFLVGVGVAMYLHAAARERDEARETTRLAAQDLEKARAAHTQAQNDAAKREKECLGIMAQLDGLKKEVTAEREGMREQLGVALKGLGAALADSGKARSELDDLLAQFLAAEGEANAALRAMQKNLNAKQRKIDELEAELVKTTNEEEALRAAINEKANLVDQLARKLDEALEHAARWSLREPGERLAMDSSYVFRVDETRPRKFSFSAKAGTSFVVLAKFPAGMTQVSLVVSGQATNRADSGPGPHCTSDRVVKDSLIRCVSLRAQTEEEFEVLIGVEGPPTELKLRILSEN